MYCTKCGASMSENETFCRACGQPVVSPQAAPGPAGVPSVPSMTPVAPVAPAEAAPIQTAYAGFWLRLVAWIIDRLILTAAYLIVLVPLVLVFFRNTPFDQPVPTPGTMILVFSFSALSIVGVWLYFALFESSTWQATPGKRALGLLVTDMQGRRISFARATGRFFGKFLSALILYIGYFMAGFTEKKQALHDILADCLVLRRL